MLRPMGDTCRHCGSDRVIAGAELHMMAGSHDVTVALRTGAAEKPDSWWDKKAINGTVSSCDICCGCGAVTLRADQPEALWTAYQAAKSKSAP
jgi:hypothetical protein